MLLQDRVVSGIGPGLGRAIAARLLAMAQSLATELGITGHCVDVNCGEHHH